MSSSPSHEAVSWSAVPGAFASAVYYHPWDTLYGLGCGAAFGFTGSYMGPVGAVPVSAAIGAACTAALRDAGDDPPSVASHLGLAVGTGVGWLLGEPVRACMSALAHNATQALSPAAVATTSAVASIRHAMPLPGYTGPLFDDAAGAIQPSSAATRSLASRRNPVHFTER